MAEKEYIEREKVYTIAKKICDAVHSGEYGGSTLPHSRIMLPHFILDLIDDLPAADVRPVVLCRDCRHRDPEDHKCDSGEMERQGCPFKVADDYFCAYGER